MEGGLRIFSCGQRSSCRHEALADKLSRWRLLFLAGNRAHVSARPGAERVFSPLAVAANFFSFEGWFKGGPGCVPCADILHWHSLSGAMHSVANWSKRDAQQCSRCRAGGGGGRAQGDCASHSKEKKNKKKKSSAVGEARRTCEMPAYFSAGGGGAAAGSVYVKTWWRRRKRWGWVRGREQRGEY